MILMKDIVRDPNPVLRKQSKRVQFPLSKKDQKLAKDMMQYLEVSQDPKLCKRYGLRAGVGLAAPQVNVSELMAAVLVPDDNDDPHHPQFKAVIINPLIIANSVQRGAMTEGEGCLSVDKDIPGLVHRADRITLQYQDMTGKKHIVRLKNYPAIVCQHEIDHLHGTLFYDHINMKDRFAKQGDEVLFS
ncbi:peptide deformylase [Acetilactobacillus jinshanensis]|uniref:Peptide deformylase n=1 Tax=Acetilactobacillus jinshanensis TaxID=1720083 RepID=A0A4P6ZK78_9LACO|nr:peptide deformylase [Acetilactobacillus jinshanensis]QBP17917.1 peptide deformylase [Acetilactobacillus jinshanensis]URL60780.1 peptide deformylase [uncultured bacterium]